MKSYEQIQKTMTLLRLFTLGEKQRQNKKIILAEKAIELIRKNQ
ncbi:hypothetical protein MNBD_GAMMA21-1105 [hydrothermal vent metagenome]|uniref:Uncharacterized protein n=1 Tax=hydrothermal vent metagenome TaxID=652676 RepID=A0A3B0ZVY3_9ZZZZ